MTKRMTKRCKDLYKLEDLVLIKRLGFHKPIIVLLIGSGGFGDVYLTKNIKLNKLYALKCLSKALIVEEKIE